MSDNKDQEKTSDEIIESTMQALYDELDAEEEAAAKAAAESEAEPEVEAEPEPEADEAADFAEADLKDELPEDEESEDEESEDEKSEDEDSEDEVPEDEVPDDEDIEDEEADEEPPKKKHNWKKILGIILGIILAVIVIVYLGFVIFFRGHFLFFTQINGVDFSLRNVEQVEDYYTDQVANYVLTIQESEGVTEEIQGTDISASYVPDDGLTQILNDQQIFLWPKSLWDHPDVETPVGVSYDEEALSSQIQDLNCMNEDNWEASVNAYPVFEDTEFVVQPEVIGTELDVDVFEQAVETAINGFKDTLNLEEADCYVRPTYLSDSEEVQEAADKMNSYLGAQITYDLDPDTVVVDSSVIAEWVKVSKKDLKVSFDKDAVKSFISDLAKQYDTAGTTRDFTTATGETVAVKGGDYGWRINQDEEYKTLTSNIKNAEVVEREPEYSLKAATHGANDWGTTYAEVDLTNQHMYYTQDGKVVLDSGVVTGNPNKGNATPAGIYSITYTQRDAVLRGTKKPDGTYEYETPVSYWMPFNGGIGFHDATWQSSFGGTRYLTNGSHGCVNMPKDKAKELFGMITQGTPVICYH